MPGIKLLAAVLLTVAAARGMAQEHRHGNGEKLGAVHLPPRATKWRRWNSIAL